MGGVKKMTSLLIILAALILPALCYIAYK